MNCARPMRSERASMTIALLTLSACASACVHAAELEWHGRAEVVGTGERVPARDVRAPAEGRWRSGAQLDLRGQVRFSDGALRFEADVQLVADYGSELRGLGSATDGDTDAPRAFDLSRTLARSGGHRVRVRADRLLIGYRADSFAVTLGRQALSWGNGQVFAPMDLLGPFAPATIDRDFKPGDDLALAQWQLGNGRDLQIVAVTRRNANGQRSARAGSLGVHWQQPVGDAELAVLAARHIDDTVLGVGVSLPLAGAVVRADWVLTHLHDGRNAASLVVNADRSFVLGERNLYVFAEVYRNGFGRGETPRELAALPADLTVRLARGEVFTTSRWYAAAGGSVEWHSLLRQQFLAVASVQDHSALLQTSLRYEPDDRTRLDATLGWSGGASGAEFAGLPLATSPGPTRTFGGGWRGELRYALYW